MDVRRKWKGPNPRGRAQQAAARGETARDGSDDNCSVEGRVRSKGNMGGSEKGPTTGDEGVPSPGGSLLWEMRLPATGRGPATVVVAVRTPRPRSHQ